MNHKAIIAIHSDGSRHLLFVAPVDFDTQAWAQSRRQAFAMLDVVRVTEG